MTKIVRLLSFFLLVSFTLVAQNSNSGEPYSFNASNLSAYIPDYVMPIVDNDELIREDAANSDKGNPLRVGIVHPVKYTPDNSGRIDILPNGDKIWRINFSSKGAFSMDISFSKFILPEGAYIYIYTPDKEYILGSYEMKDAAADSTFITPDIPGEEIILEYYEPVEVAFEGQLEIDGISHTYRDFFNLKGYHGTAEGECHINAVCQEGDDWREEIRSVVMIKISTSTEVYMCSGAMINNTRFDKTPYVYTADHCYKAGSSYKFYFEYQTLTCDGNTGAFNRVATGGEVKARSTTNVLTSSSDFMLLLITGELKDPYRDNIYFAGWDRSGNAPGTGVGIHHPGGDYKKLSFPRLVTSASGYMADKFWTVGWYTGTNNKGVTEQGSSGSPLFSTNHLIVGSLSNGSSACDYMQGYDNYGKLSYSWTNNNNSSSAKKLQPWLDPDNLGYQSIQGISYLGNVAIPSSSSESNSFQVYPNPSDGQVKIEGSFNFNNATCNVYNMMGKLVFSQNISLNNSCFLNLNHLNNGIYIMEIMGNNQSLKTKMIISK